MIRRAFLSVLIASPVLAAGFRLDVNSARGTAMVGAVSALVDDASANFYNPAGLAQAGKGFEAMAGVTLILPQVHFTSTAGDTASTAFTAVPPPHVYARLGLFDWLAFGIGMFTQYGNNVTWPDAWAGRFLATQSNLQTFNVDLNVALRPHRRISLAGGLDIVRGTVYLARDFNFIDSTGALQMGGGAWGWGYNFGLQLEVIEDVMYFGGTVRGSTPLNFTGNAHFDNVPEEFASQLYDQPISASVTLPLTASFGLGFKIGERLRIEADVTYVDWSAFQALTVNFSKNPALSVPQQKKWWDTAAFQIGAEYDVSQSISARLGFMVDPTPSPSSTLTPDLPDSTRLNFGAGIGWRHASGLKIDFGFQLVALLAHESTSPGFTGTYGGTAEVLSLSVGWKTKPVVAVVEPAVAPAQLPPSPPQPPQPSSATPEATPAQ